VRTWVSGTGDDLNSCTRTAPCKTFSGAISRTAPGGVIHVLDPGGFGAVTITKALSIVTDSNVGAITALGTTGIIVNAAPGDVVHLDGLTIDGGVSGINGIRFLAGGELHVRNCVIRGFRGTPGVGISLEPTAAGNSRLYVEDSTVSNNTGGILVKSSGAASATAIRWRWPGEAEALAHRPTRGNGHGGRCEAYGPRKGTAKRGRIYF
jgi:hypothetical protein